MNTFFFNSTVQPLVCKHAGGATVNIDDGTFIIQNSYLVKIKGK